jgi:hypothetical protein
VSVEDLLRANLLDVFGERDPERRRAAVERTYTPDVTFADPEETVVGHQALADKAQRLLDDAPGFVFRPDGPARVVQDLGHLAWAFGPEGQDPVVRGIDVVLVTDGRISRVYTMLTS